MGEASRAEELANKLHEFLMASLCGLLFGVDRYYTVVEKELLFTWLSSVALNVGELKQRFDEMLGVEPKVWVPPEHQPGYGGRQEPCQDGIQAHKRVLAGDLAGRTGVEHAPPCTAETKKPHKPAVFCTVHGLECGGLRADCRTESEETPSAT